MKIILLGYGKMGHEVEKIALQRGHEILARIDNEEDWTSFENSETQKLRNSSHCNRVQHSSNSFRQYQTLLRHEHPCCMRNDSMAPAF